MQHGRCRCLLSWICGCHSNGWPRGKALRDKGVRRFGSVRTAFWTRDR